ncbi:MAG: ABC-2 family transporter protein [Caldilineaceae bacterium]|nr:ABC-2 family transporter protein [Caldilineaceae bacterium]
MKNIQRELQFLLAIWQANLLAAMEYRVAFLSQVIGMMLNNAIYFVFWILFFDRFQAVQGWALNDMLLLFGVVATGFGAAVYLFGNVTALAETIASGRLDYYLSLPRPVLLHVLASGSIPAGMGDFTYGLFSFLAAGHYSVDAIARFIFGALIAMVLFIAVLVIVHSAAFWLGHADGLAAQTFNALITFSLYPITMFDGVARFLLFTIFPAAFIGAIPAEFIRAFSWAQFGQLLLAATIFLTLAVVIFQRGLQRYESGSAIQTQL